MYDPDNPPTLDCQDCGQILKKLSQAEALQVAQNPYNFIMYCRECTPYHRQGDL